MLQSDVELMSVTTSKRREVVRRGSLGSYTDLDLLGLINPAAVVCRSGTQAAIEDGFALRL